MTYTSQPWTLEPQEPKALKTRREELQLKEINRRVEAAAPISVAKIVNFLNKNKNQTFTNAQIALATGLSSSTVSGVMDKLEEIGSVKVVKIRKGISSGISQVYQIATGSLNKVEKERMAEGPIVTILSVFNKSVNKTYTNKELAEVTEIPISKISNALSILLVTKNIKIVGSKDNKFIYQHVCGNKQVVEVSTEPNSNYITLSSYLKMRGIKSSEKFELNGHSRLFHSDQGIIEEYEVAYLQKVIKDKKGIFDKIKEAIKV